MTNFKDKLSNLRNRRLGEVSTFAFDAALSTGLEHLIYNSRSEKENYETRATGEATKYALGAMQQVGARYTEISYEEGKRVISQIANGLSALPLKASFEFQGSVPLNVHIRGVSDVDILVLMKSLSPSTGTARLPELIEGSRTHQQYWNKFRTYGHNVKLFLPPAIRQRPLILMATNQFLSLAAR